MSAEIRVAVVILRYHPIFGGQENQCRLLNRNLLQLQMVKIPFLVTSRLKRGLPKNERIDSILVNRMGLPGDSRASRYSFYAAVALTLWKRRDEFDVIHCHSTDIIGFVVTAMGRLLGKPVVLKLSGNGEFLQETGFWKRGPRNTLKDRMLARVRRFIRELPARHAHIVALSGQGILELKHGGVLRAVVIPNGIDRTIYAPISEKERAALRKRHGFTESARLLLFTGRFVKGKGIDLLLSAFGGLIQKCFVDGSELRLCLIGSGDDQCDAVAMEDLRRFVNAHPDKILLFPPRTSVVEWLRIADLFVFPSRQEGMPNAVLEALAVGLPCVLSDIPPHLELAQANSHAEIRFFASGESPSLEMAMKLALDDISRCRGVGARLSSRLDCAYDIQEVTKRYLGLYQSALRPA